MQINWHWLIVGIIPYFIKRQCTQDEQMLSIQALLWRLTICWRCGKCSWDVSLPFITHQK